MIELSIVVSGEDVQGEVAAWLEGQGLTWAEADDLSSEREPSEDAKVLQFLLYFENQLPLDELLQKLANRWPNDRQAEIHWHYRPIRDEIWQQAWQPEKLTFESECFRISIGGPLRSSSCDRFEIVMQAVEAFGSGQHATTLASLRMLERLPPQSSLLDVGTVTGILAIAAKKLGYERVLATDIDATACDDAAINAAANQVTFELLASSLPDPAQVPSDGFQVIVSNILPPVIHQLVPDFRRLSTDGGALILAGIHEANADSLVATCLQHGYTLQEQTDERGWLALLLSAGPRLAWA